MLKRVDLTEFNKLEKLLKDASIPYERIETKDIPDDVAEAMGRVWSFEHHEIFYPNSEIHTSDVVIFRGSYGHEEGLLEQMGLIPSGGDSVQGYLTAEEVFLRWKEHFDKSKVTP